MMTDCGSANLRAQSLLHLTKGCAMLCAVLREMQCEDFREREKTTMLNWTRNFPVTIAVATGLLCLAANAPAQERAELSSRRANHLPVVEAGARAGEAKPSPREAPPLMEREVELLARIEQLEQRLAELEARVAEKLPPQSALPDAGPPVVTTNVAASMQQSPTPGARAAADFLRETTLSFTLDGYYGYNFNRPAGRINLLRAYDVLSNSFSLNQAAVIFERAPDPAAGRRFGLRLDLQYGQATETLQGSAVNEPRPQVYRPVFQAYGTYVIPLGSGLSADFGKWASALGMENNYTKDQLNYSRSYFYNFLPFYHFGFRASYSAGPVTVGYWLVNGANQSEDFNGFKSNAILLTIKPTKTIAWNVNYYFGREQRDVVPALNPGIPTSPTQPGLSTTPVLPTPRGREHILDTYISWNASSKLLLAAEADYVINRVNRNSHPTQVTGAAGYARYQFSPSFSLAGRFEYLSDRGGLFSGVTQALKEGTVTATYQFVDGFQMRWEFRRDFSNKPFFLTRSPGLLKHEQDTATLGLIWWFGGKQGAW